MVWKKKKHFRMQACRWIYLRSNKMSFKFNNLENAANDFCESFFDEETKLFIGGPFHGMDVAEIVFAALFEPHWTIDMFPVCVYTQKSWLLCDTIDDLFYELLLLTQNDLSVSWLANFIGLLSCRSISATVSFAICYLLFTICYLKWWKDGKNCSHNALERNQQ